MGELYDDRRQEPRFSAAGIYRRETGGDASGHIFDLSLNGAMLEQLAAAPLIAGERINVILSFPSQPEFIADVLVQHVVENRVGVEFYDMSPAHFSTLAALIERHVRAR
jgi:hypothetical protein